MHSKEIYITAIGGGHGLGKVLNTFSDYGHRLSGIVATTDNGGSTGRLREASDCIAWGDLRNCLSHLAGEQSLGAQLLEYRFTESELAGHSMGNLLFFALEKLRFSPVEALELVRRMLKVESRIYPMSEQPTHLKSTNNDGSIILGETSIDAADLPIPKHLTLTDDVCAPTRAIRALSSANIILLGPGSFFTSILPPLLVNNIYQAIASSKAKVILIDNLAQEVGPAGAMDLNDKLGWIKQHFAGIRIDAVLTHPKQEPIKDSAILLHKAELSEHELSYRHDEVALRKALEALFCQF